MPLPEGFVIDENPPPEGFVVDTEQAAEPGTKSERMWRDLKLAGRVFAEAPALVMAGGADLMAGGVNLGLSGLSKAQEAIGGEPITARLPTESVSTVMEGWDRISGVQPETRGERYATNIVRAGAGIPFGVGGGQYAAQGATSPVARAVGEQFARSPGGQALAATAGTAASTRAAEAGAGPVGQTVAGVAGGMAPAAAVTGISAGVRGAVRGGPQGRQAFAQTVDDFNRSGMEPSIGQAGGGRVARGAEAYSSRMPGGAGRMVKVAEQQADDMAAGIEQRASQLASKTSAGRAGMTILRGITDEGGFIDRARSVQSRLYSELDNFIMPESRIPVQNISQTLDDMAAQIPGAERTSGILANPQIRAIREALMDDASRGPMIASSSRGTVTSGSLPFRALKELRTMIGEKLENVGVVSDVSRAEWKRLYGALTRDIEAAVTQTQDDAARQAWSRAVNYTRGFHRRLDIMDSVLRRAGGPERVFTAAMSGTKEGNTVLHSIMQSLKPSEQKVLTATVLRRMGLATPGQQNELGSAFSTETFLTNWNRLSPQARGTLFDRFGSRFRADMDRVARVAANLREGAQVFRNPSGTAQASFQQGTVGAFALGVLTGQWEAAAGIGALVIGNNLAARVMTNPNAVRWLARQTRVPASQLPAQMQLLAARARETNDEELALLYTILEEAQNREGQATINSMPEMQ